MEKSKAQSQSQKSSAKGHVLKISGPLDGPRVTVDRAPEAQLVN
jgi:hypothetical protein